MATQQYALEPHGPRRLVVTWNGFWKNMVISYDGMPVGSVADKKALTNGQEFVLPDGSCLRVQLVQGFGATELRLSRDGEPLPGSAADPITRVNIASGILFFIAALNAVLGIVAMVFQVDFLQELGLGLFSIVYGLVFVLLGWLVRRRSMAALIIAIAIFVIDGLLSLVLSASAGGSPFIVRSL